MDGAHDGRRAAGGGPGPSWGRPSSRCGCGPGTARGRARTTRRWSSSGRPRRCAGWCGRPDELGLARAYVAGEIDVEGDLYAPFAALSSTGRLAPGESPGPVARASGWRWCAPALALGAIGPRAAAAAGGGPPPPVRPAAQPAPGRRRDRPPLRRRQRLLRAGPRAVDGLLLRRLGRTRPSAWTPPRRPSSTWSAASSGCGPGMRLLDVGCGWGSLAMHAAQRVRRRRRRHHAVRRSRRRWPASGSPRPGSPDGSTIRVQDYRAVDDGPFDAISSVGMAEHVGPGEAARATSPPSHALLRPGRPAAQPRHLLGRRRRPPGTTTPSSPATSSPTASWSASATWSTP